MANIKCAISGLEFKCSYIPAYIPVTAGYFHPIFALPRKRLYTLYSKHCQGHLTTIDSYLLFLAFLHSTDKVQWKVPATLQSVDLETFIENNLAQLIRITELSEAIQHPSFKQPKFVVSSDSADLASLPNWIAGWEQNIEDFRNGYRAVRYQESLARIESKLEYYIKSGAHEESYASTVASWADKAACFPAPKKEYWVKTIRSCFNSSKMFSTPLAELKELKAYCEENITPGSIYHYTLMSILKEGIGRHVNFLGLDSSALGYNLLPVDTTIQDVELESIKAKAPENKPVRTNYTSDLAYLRAKLAFAVVANKANRAERIEDNIEEVSTNE